MTDSAAPASREFHIGDLLSITTGRLVSPRHIGGVYDIIDFITGVAHMTHQLPRAGEAIKPRLLQQHPWLADITVPDGLERDEVFGPWLAEIVAKHGETHLVTAMPFGEYVGREPIAELREMAPNTPIIAVVADPDGGAR